MGCKKPDCSLAPNFLLKTYKKVADIYSFVKILGDLVVVKRILDTEFTEGQRCTEKFRCSSFS
jgi:hypothetical protein